MARFGTGINPSLGRIDYTPYMQGAIAGGQSIAQGIASLGQAAGNAIRDYKKKKEEEQNIANTISFLKTNFKKDPTTYSVFADQDGNFDENAAEAATRSIGSNGVMSFINFTQAAQANRDAKADKEREKQISKTVNDLLSTSDPTALQVKIAASDPEAVARYEQAKLDRDYRRAQIELAAAQGTKLDVESTLEAQKMGQVKDPRPTPPAGFEYTSSDFGNTTMREIPGGPAAIAAEEKMTAKEEKQRALDERVRAQQIKLDATLGNIDQAIRLSRGGAGGPFEGIPFVNQATRVASVGMAGSKTSNLSSLIESINAGVAIDEIEALKAQSPTGSTGFGNLTEGERQALSSVIVQLKPELPERELQDRLIKLRDTLMKLRGNRSANPQTAESIAPESEDDAALANRFLGRNRGFRSTTR
jgi:hypothetical protein